ncbi:hypothetical protein AKG95_29185 (plasmid) [Janthinobacterium lividum]|uniref:Uncharacterized protein n=1 Tax=Janthinobacterium lividum TaxID=29581 RepID=A0A1S1U0U8_9BURK|nr:hypothetical protein AKG95_29185 [Janthinobacterium lividum]
MKPLVRSAAGKWRRTWHLQKAIAPGGKCRHVGQIPGGGTIARGQAGGGWPAAEEGARRQRRTGRAPGRGPPYRPGARQAAVERKTTYRMRLPFRDNPYYHGRIIALFARETGMMAG